MTPTAYDLLDRLPEELKWCVSWAVAGPDKAPYSVSGNKLYPVSVNSPSDWLDFETACEWAQATGGGVGFILSDADPYTVIDLDVTDAEKQAAKGEQINPSKWTTKEELDRYWFIAKYFNSYTEMSRSAKGLHIWLRGDIGKGIKREGVEVYSRQRFIICTGNAVLNVPILRNDAGLETLCAEIKAGQVERASELIEVESDKTDEQVWQMAATASNDHKFVALCEGRWKDLGYPSQSEADLSLMSMFTFYSKSNEQCKRLFRATELGKREKAVKNDRYLNFTLSVIRGRQEREDEAQEHGKQLAEQLMKRKDLNPVGNLIHNMEQSLVLQRAEQLNRVHPAPAAVQVAQLNPLPKAADGGLPWPPGLAGALAGFIYNSAYRPVKEIAITAALGMLAGICGKSYNIPGSGLNIYITFVAASAVGKEQLHRGPALMMNAIVKRCPAAGGFINFDKFVSGQALSKQVAANPSFCSIIGEWGKVLTRLARDSGKDAAMESLRTIMTDLYQKSAASSIVGGMVYSNRDNNVGSVSGVAYSMVGETTPKVFYESLTESMMEDGFLSRFSVIEYDGLRVPHNANANEEPDSALADAMAYLCSQSISLITRHEVQQVGRTEEVLQAVNAFEIECDSRINETYDEAKRQMWNRAALKAMRIAGLLAVAENYINPTIEMKHWQWSLELIRRDIAMFTRKVENGDIGISDNSREKKLLAILREYFMQGASPSYKIPIELQSDHIIPRRYLQMRLQRINCFVQHRMGSVGGIDSTVKSAIESGYLQEVDVFKDKAYKFGAQGKCYRIINLPEM